MATKVQPRSSHPPNHRTLLAATLLLPSRPAQPVPAQPSRPPPHTLTLRLLLRLHCYAAADIGVYLPWCSCYQNPRDKAHILPYVRSQQRATMWYVHSLTTVFLVSDVPEGSTPLMKRGWVRTPSH